MLTEIPAAALQLRSLVRADRTVELFLETIEVPEPGPGEVVVRVEASPINPSDLGLLLAGADAVSYTHLSLGRFVPRNSTGYSPATSPGPRDQLGRCWSARARRASSRSRPAGPAPPMPPRCLAKDRGAASALPGCCLPLLSASP